jgi:hypothetical protein
MNMAVLPRPLLAPAGCHVRKALLRADRQEAPYRHWLLRNVLPDELCTAVAKLPFAPPAIEDTLGKRETHNSERIFVTPENRLRYSACAALAETFQDEATTGLLTDMTGVDLGGSYLRIECCLDRDGFWLEPHTDIGAKLFTMLVYLSDDPNAEDWGTDLMDANGNVVGRAPGSFNTGLIFIPASDSWHGFVKRQITGLRRSLIVNYVKPEWRSRHELAFFDQPVVGAG